MRVIGIVGAKGAGKSTLADAFGNEGFTRIEFGAEEAKAAIAAAAAASLPGPLGVSFAVAASASSTSWLWVNAARDRLEEALERDPSACFVFDPVETEAQAEIIRSVGGEVWVVRRAEAEPSLTLGARFVRLLWDCSLPASQTLWSTTAPDVTIENAASLHAFVRACASAVTNYLRVHPDPLIEHVLADIAADILEPPRPDPQLLQEVARAAAAELEEAARAEAAVAPAPASEAADQHAAVDAEPVPLPDAVALDPPPAGAAAAAGAPNDAPAGAPDGAPAGAPDGAPAGAPDGAPAGAPDGAPADAVKRKPSKPRPAKRKPAAAKAAAQAKRRAAAIDKATRA